MSSKIRSIWLSGNMKFEVPVCVQLHLCLNHAILKPCLQWSLPPVTMLTLCGRGHQKVTCTGFDLGNPLSSRLRSPALSPLSASGARTVFATRSVGGVCCRRHGFEAQVGPNEGERGGERAAFHRCPGSFVVGAALSSVYSRMLASGGERKVLSRVEQKYEAYPGSCTCTCTPQLITKVGLEIRTIELSTHPQPFYSLTIASVFLEQWRTSCQFLCVKY